MTINSRNWIKDTGTLKKLPYFNRNKVGKLFVIDNDMVQQMGPRVVLKFAVWTRVHDALVTALNHGQIMLD